MKKEASAKAQQMIEQHKLNAEDIAAAGDKITAPDVESHLKQLTAESENDGTDNENDESAASDDVEQEAEAESAAEGESSGDGKSEAQAIKADSGDESGESGSKGGESKPAPVKKGTLLCRFTIKEDGKKFLPNEPYTGKNKDYLLKRGSVYYS